ncbi:MAG: M20/M25/M40 family metallo-hydrolase [Prolixibacteraceae bacterium]|jgi:carboxypeptidase PM20D1|nr:M20/M25/M40 family metallo-hydrolase [Prolixibacteraceae bacterium]
MRHFLSIILFFGLFPGVSAQLSILPEQLLSEYVQIESVTGNEAPAALFLLEKCREAGLNTFIFHDEQNSFNFAASLYPLESGKPNVVFHSHCDVVHEGDSAQWTYLPYSGTIADSAVWGRGVVDNKAMSVMGLMALGSFIDTAKSRDLPFNFTMLVVSNEEEGGQLGAGRVINEYLDLLNPVVVFGEGGAGMKNILTSDPKRTVFGISVIHKQGMWLELSLKNNSSAHGAIVSDDNINVRMVNGLHRLGRQKRKLKITDASSLMVKELSTYEKGLLRCIFRHPRFFFPLAKKRILKNPLLSLIFTDTYNITNINSPYSPMNSVAGEIRAILDCRFLEPTYDEDVVRRISKKTKCPEMEIQVLKKTPGALYTHPDRYYDWLRKAILQNTPGAAVVPMLFPAIADNNYFRNKGIPTYGFFPCRLEVEDINRIHNTNEQISFGCLYQGIDIYKKLIQTAISELPGKEE